MESFSSSTPDSYSFLPLSEPELSGNEWKYLRECLDTNWVSYLGPFVDRFENMVADYLGVKHAVATNSGTAALHVALLTAGVQPEDEVLTSTLTFIAPANSIRYVGAWPVFIDSESDYWQLDPERVIDFLERECRWERGALYNRSTNRRVRAILPVHLLGHPVDMKPILEVARKYELIVIEDAAEGLGATYNGKKVGALADIACLSFNGNKVVTAGGGGMLVTDSDDVAYEAKHLSTQAKDHPVEYIHNEIGYNYRLTNIQAALGLAQMEQLEGFIDKKRNHATTYAEGLSGLTSLSLMPESEGAFCTYWLYTVLLDAKLDSRELISRLNSHGIQSRPLWMPIHRQRRYMECTVYGGEVADKLYATGIQLPSSVGINEQELEYCIEHMIALCSA